MSKLLLNFAFATSLYTEKRNYLETFSPFVLKALRTINKKSTSPEICAQIEKESNLKIPTNTCRSILRALSREGYVKEEIISRNDSKYLIHQKGLDFLKSGTETEDKIKRKHNELFSAFQEQLKASGVEIDLVELEKKIISFIKENLDFLTLLTTGGQTESVFRLNDPVHEHLVGFIYEIENRNPTLYETFEELLKGAILWSHIANQEELPEKESAFEPLTVYCDANILLSFLGLHHPSINEAASQLLKLLREERKISLKVLSITLDEISRLLKTYRYRRSNYNANIAVNSIFYFLKKQGYDDIRTLDLINNLDKKTEAIGITIEKKEFVDPEFLKGGEKELYQTLYTFNRLLNEEKNEQEQKEENALHLSTLHDATAISHVKSTRGAWVKSLERSKTIFLTESFRLDEFCKEQYKAQDRFPEVILDLTLTNILWLKNPKKDFSVQLHKLIAAHSKKMLIDTALWDRFTSALNSHHKSGKLTAQQYAVLFSSNQLTIDYIHRSRRNKITLDSLTELAEKIERDILKDKSAKRVKDSIISKKNEELAEIRSEIEAKKAEIESLENSKVNNESTIETLTEELAKSERQIKDQGGEIQGLTARISLMERNQKKVSYVNQKMEENYAPLGKQAFLLLIGTIVVIIATYLSQVADGDDQNFLRLSSGQFKACKLIGLIVLMLLTVWVGKVYKFDMWRYVFGAKKLKAEMKVKYEKEFDEQN